MYPITQLCIQILSYFASIYNLLLNIIKIFLFSLFLDKLEQLQNLGHCSGIYTFRMLMFREIATVVSMFATEQPSCIAMRNARSPRTCFGLAHERSNEESCRVRRNCGDFHVSLRFDVFVTFAREKAGNHFYSLYSYLLRKIFLYKNRNACVEK